MAKKYQEFTKEPDEQLNVRIPWRIARKIKYRAYITNNTKKGIVIDILEEVTAKWPDPPIVKASAASVKQ